MGSKLNPKVKCFIAEYIKDNNAIAAASRAGYSDPDYGNQLITNPNVAQAFTQQQKAAIAEIFSSQIGQPGTPDAN
ncbi:TPA: terminase small subunit [Enterobacter cancerogenus]